MTGASELVKNVAIWVLIAAGYGLVGYPYWRSEKRHVAEAAASGAAIDARVFKSTQKVCFLLVIAVCGSAWIQSARWGITEVGWFLVVGVLGFVAAIWASVLFGGLLVSLIAGRRARWKARIAVWIALVAVVAATTAIASSNGPMKARFAMQRTGFDRLAVRLGKLCAEARASHPGEKTFELNPPFPSSLDGPVGVQKLRCDALHPETVEFDAGTQSFFINSQTYGFANYRPYVASSTKPRTLVPLSGGWWYWVDNNLSF